jgi:hypothetical protein
MTIRRSVAVSDLLDRHARACFPAGALAAGAPSIELFQSGPLKAAELFFGDAFDMAPEAAPGIRVWVTIDLPFFPPLAFYAVLMQDDHVELLDFSIEDPQDYWSLMDDNLS